MTCLNLINPLNKSSYQVDKSFSISMSITSMVGLALAVLGGLALAGVYHPYVNTLGSLAIIGKSGAVVMIAAGCTVVGIAISLCCFRKVEKQSADNKPFKPGAPTESALKTKAVTENIDNLYKDAKEQEMFKKACEGKYAEETIVYVYDTDLLDFVYNVHIIPKGIEMEYRFYPPKTEMHPTNPLSIINHDSINRPFRIS